MSPNNADGMANSVDPDQTAPLGSLIWVCTVCPGLSVWKLRIITVTHEEIIRVPWKFKYNLTAYPMLLNLEFFSLNYRKKPKCLDTQKIAVIILKLEHYSFTTE